MVTHLSTMTFSRQAPSPTTLPCIIMQFLTLAPLPILALRDKTLCSTLPSRKQPSAISEAAPFIKTGGLGDVAAALPKALAETPNTEVYVFLKRSPSS